MNDTRTERERCGGLKAEGGGFDVIFIPSIYVDQHSHNDYVDSGCYYPTVCFTIKGFQV